MKRSFTALFAVLLVAVLLLPMVPISSGAAFTISGTVIKSTDGNRTPLAGVTVELYSGDSVVDTVTTSGNGTFSFGADDTITNYSLSFSIDTYGTFFVGGSAGEITAVDGKYPVDPSVSTGLTVIMVPTSGTITGHVTNEDGQNLGEVKIDLTARNSSTVLQSVKTDADGKFSITYSTGDYSLTASRSDYKTLSKNITISASDNSPVDFVLERSANTFIFGMDLAHSLMFIGILIGVLAILAVAVYRVRLNKHEDTITVEEILDESEE